ncbi:MAG: SdpI family protein [Bacteroidia bacterium]|nr:SdpI family protein [Bacteroidia bacterium]
MENQTTQTANGSMKSEWFFWLILLLPFLYIPFIWDKLPESVPTHWNIHGEPDKFSSKEVGTFLLPLINIGMYLLLLILPKIDPRKRNYNYFGNAYRNIRLALALFMVIIFFIAMQWSIGSKMINAKLVFIVVFALLAVMGNFMRTIRSNFFIGIRTPWTLDNPEVWRRTHERSGKLWFYSSLAAILITFIISENYMTIFLIAYIAVTSIYPIIYSYLLFRKIRKAKA